MKAFVTGGAGFLGSNLTDRLVHDGHDVIVFDNFSTGREEFLIDAKRSSRVKIVSGDVRDARALSDAMRGSDVVFHFAANADVRFGTLDPSRDFEQNTFATFCVLEVMRATAVRRMIFASTASIYGETNVFPTPEDAPFPVQTSLYGASKLACEGMITAYCEAYDMQSSIIRFTSILGERYTHGHVFDFVKSLRLDPARLRVLGDGKQRKSYLHVKDCVDALLRVLNNAPARVNIFNAGHDTYSEVNDSVAWIANHLGVSPRVEYTGGDRGWVGDSPFIFLDCSRLHALGWKPALSIQESVIRTVDYLQENPWVMEESAR